MTPARARSRWLAGTVLLGGTALVAACSGSPSAEPATAPTSASTSIDSTQPSTTALPATTPESTTTIAGPGSASAVGAPSTVVPVDPSLLIPVSIGNKPFPAPGDELAAEYHGFTGDPNATLQQWLITPMIVPAGPDVRLLGFERTVGISSTTATFLTGAIDPQAVLDTIAAAIAPPPTYTVTPSTRTEGSVTIYVFDAQPNTVQGDPPGWTVEASTVAQLGVVRIMRNDYSFSDAVATFADLPATLQDEVAHQDAIAVNAGGVMSSISYEYGVGSLGDPPAHRTRLTYDVAGDFPTATADISRLLNNGWDKNEQTDAVYFTSATTSEVWTLDEFGGTPHLTYDTGN